MVGYGPAIMGVGVVCVYPVYGSKCRECTTDGMECVFNRAGTLARNAGTLALILLKTYFVPSVVHSWLRSRCVACKYGSRMGAELLA